LRSGHAAPGVGGRLAIAIRSARAIFRPREMTRATVLSHEDLFVEREASRCDACGRSLASDDGGSDRSYDPPGHGVYLWVRGGEVRFERVPLCPSWASAIGMTALARWEIEEEEG